MRHGNLTGSYVRPGLQMLITAANPSVGQARRPRRGRAMRYQLKICLVTTRDETRAVVETPVYLCATVEGAHLALRERG